MKRIAYITSLLAVLASPLATGQEFSAVLRARDIPVDASKPASQSLVAFENASVQLEIDPTKQTRNILGDLETTEQQLRLITRYDLTKTVFLTYETGAGAQRSDRAASWPSNAEIQQQLSRFHRARLSVKVIEPLTLSASTEAGTASRNDADASSQHTAISTEAVLVPWKDSAIRTGVARRDMTGFDGSIVTQDVTSAGIEQKFTWIPVTLRSTVSRTSEEKPLFADTDTDRWQTGAEWKPVDWFGLSSGYEMRSVESTDPFADQDVTAWFTQLQLRPAQAITLTVRPSSETITRSPGTAAESVNDRFTLTVGGLWRLAETISAGVSVKYPIIDNAAAAPLKPYFSLSATASF